MAEWTFYAWESGTSTSTATAVFLSSSSAYALSFGAGGRSNFQGNINLNTWNNALHLAANTAESSTDLCVTNHLWPLHPASGFSPTGGWSSAAVCYINSASSIATMSASSPRPSQGIDLHFNHTFGVRCNPVNVWAGSGTTGDSPITNCIVGMVELHTVSPQWSTPDPTNKLSLTAHTASADTDHDWFIGISIMPTIVGFNDSNRLKVECTYY